MPPPKKRPVRPGKRPAGGAPPRELPRVRRVAGRSEWEFAPPPCVRARAEDLEEVRAMIEAEEHEIARDELLWLLGGCDANLEAHCLLGDLAVAAGDWKLARGHYGYAYELGVKALPRGDLEGELPYRRPANEPFFAAARGLALCLEQLGELELARKVAQRMVQLDAGDPLGFGPWLLGWPPPATTPFEV